MQTTHTPAPWTLAAGHSTRVLLINDARGHAVGEYVDTRNPADARLIAAAPELLAALNDLLPIAARSVQGTTDGEPLLARARAAITRATGGAA